MCILYVYFLKCFYIPILLQEVHAHCFYFFLHSTFTSVTCDLTFILSSPLKKKKKKCLTELWKLPIQFWLFSFLTPVTPQYLLLFNIPSLPHFIEACFFSPFISGFTHWVLSLKLCIFQFILSWGPHFRA